MLSSGWLNAHLYYLIIAHAMLSPPVCMLARSGAHARFTKKCSEFDSPLQNEHTCLLKGVLGVKITTPIWAVLRECGQEEPLPFYWFRAAAKFLNSTLRE